MVKKRRTKKHFIEAGDYPALSPHIWPPKPNRVLIKELNLDPTKVSPNARLYSKIKELESKGLTEEHLRKFPEILYRSASNLRDNIDTLNYLGITNPDEQVEILRKDLLSGDNPEGRSYVYSRAGILDSASAHLLWMKPINVGMRLRRIRDKGFDDPVPSEYVRFSSLKKLELKESAFKSIVISLGLASEETAASLGNKHGFKFLKSVPRGEEDESYIAQAYDELGLPGYRQQNGALTAHGKALVRIPVESIAESIESLRKIPATDRKGKIRELDFGGRRINTGLIVAHSQNPEKTIDRINILLEAGASVHDILKKHFVLAFHEDDLSAILRLVKKDKAHSLERAVEKFTYGRKR